MPFLRALKKGIIEKNKKEVLGYFPNDFFATRGHPWGGLPPKENHFYSQVATLSFKNSKGISLDFALIFLGGLLSTNHFLSLFGFRETT